MFAALCATEGEDRPMQLRTDSKYVYSGLKTHDMWCRWGRKGGHAELWHEVSRRLAGKPNEFFEAAKVKGHAKQCHVDICEMQMEDKLGNDCAGALAVAAAGEHAVPWEIVRAHNARVRMARATQRMIVRIVKARRGTRAPLRAGTCRRKRRRGR